MIYLVVNHIDGEDADYWKFNRLFEAIRYMSDMGIEEDFILTAPVVDSENETTVAVGMDGQEFTIPTGYES